MKDKRDRLWENERGGGNVHPLSFVSNPSLINWVFKFLLCFFYDKSLFFFWIVFPPSESESALCAQTLQIAPWLSTTLIIISFLCCSSQHHLLVAPSCTGDRWRIYYLCACASVLPGTAWSEVRGQRQFLHPVPVVNLLHTLLSLCLLSLK